MNISHQKNVFFYFMLFGLFLLSSCAQTPPYEQEINIMVSPHKLSVNSGSEDKVFVKLLDKQGGPLFGVKVTAKSAAPTVATVTPEALTDPVGKAIFLVHGISAGSTQIVFSAMGQKATMEVVFIGH